MCQYYTFPPQSISYAMNAIGKLAPNSWHYVKRGKKLVWRWKKSDFPNSQAEMAAYLGSGGVESWSNSHADVILASDNGTENLTGRSSLDEATKEQLPSIGNGDTASGAETGRGTIFVQGHCMLSP